MGLHDKITDKNLQNPTLVWLAY